MTHSVTHHDTHRRSTRDAVRVPVWRSLLFSRLRAVVGTADTGRALLLQLNLGPHSDLTEEEFKCAALGFNPGTANA